MENNSLFKTRQLTEYRVWPTGDKGCLFYVTETPFNERSQGAIYLIDAPWREGDEIGMYNQLHHFELNSLTNLQPIAKGFAAFLLTQNSDKWVEDRKLLDKWWQAYYLWCMDQHPRSGFEPEYIVQECANWAVRSKDVLTCYLRKPDMELYLDAMRHIIRAVLFRCTESVEMVMRTLHPFISIQDKNSKDMIIQYDYHTKKIMSGQKEILSGFQAILINFAAVHHSVQWLFGAQNLDRIVGYILKRLDNSPADALSVNDLRMPDYDRKKARKLYDFSINLNKRNIELKHKYDTSFDSLTDQEQDWEVLNELFWDEIELVKKDSVITLLPQEETQIMRFLLSGYFRYLDKRLEGSDYSKDVHAELLNVFPELQRRKPSPKPISEGKIVTPKKSRHFLPTPTFVYKYLNADATSSRRLPLLYQYLSKEYHEVKSYIETETNPDDFYSIFNGETNNNVIVWTASKQDLYYFIKRMVERNIINIPKGESIWNITQNHFSDRRGNLYLDLRNQHNPKNSALAIEQLIDILDPAVTTAEDLTELARKLGASFGGK